MCSFVYRLKFVCDTVVTHNCAYIVRSRYTYAEREVCHFLSCLFQALCYSVNFYIFWKKLSEPQLQFQIAFYNILYWEVNSTTFCGTLSKNWFPTTFLPIMSLCSWSSPTGSRQGPTGNCWFPRSVGISTKHLVFTCCSRYHNYYTSAGAEFSNLAHCWGNCNPYHYGVAGSPIGTAF